MVGLLNLGSIVLGLIAWTLPLVNLMRYRKNWVILSIMSISACAISLCLQIFYNYHLVKIEDWAALLDITGAVVLASVVLVIVTLLLNIFTLVEYRRKNFYKG
ncbi:hypothetical protein GCM10008967_32510 [Bacillus carboniphilus]|uniref:Cytochrome c oxidase subunit 4 n=1 Tax=Bacillus carboniphilus TaxID=86663 RepID=A0ABN0WJ88_9BACI